MLFQAIEQHLYPTINSRQKKSGSVQPRQFGRVCHKLILSSLRPHRPPPHPFIGVTENNILRGFGRIPGALFKLRFKLSGSPAGITKEKADLGRLHHTGIEQIAQFILVATPKQSGKNLMRTLNEITSRMKKMDGINLIISAVIPLIIYTIMR